MIRSESTPLEAELDSALLQRVSRSSSVAIVDDAVLGAPADASAARAIAELFPYATIFSPFSPGARLADDGSLSARVRASLPALLRPTPWRWLPLMPAAIAALDLSAFDLVISLSCGVAKGVRKAPGAVHVSYVRSLVSGTWQPLEQRGLGRVVAQATRSYLRRWDRAVSGEDRIDLLIATSEFVAAQIEHCYERKAVVVPPFAEARRTHTTRRDRGYYLLCSELEAHAHVELALTAFNALELPLYVVGHGRAEQRLRALAGANVRLLGEVDDSALAELYAGARALIVPHAHDSGSTFIAAANVGLPVIAYGAGAAMEAAIDGITGKFFRPQTAAALAAAVRALEVGQVSFNASRLQQHARQFSKAQFQRRVLAAVRRAWLLSGRRAATFPGGLPH